MTKKGLDPSAPKILIGSHLDSVPHGGNYDGAAGVVGGLGVVQQLDQGGTRLRNDLVVCAFRAEEAAWFPLSYFGSYAALGLFDTSLLDTPRSDTGLSEAPGRR